LYINCTWGIYYNNFVDKKYVLWNLYLLNACCFQRHYPKKNLSYKSTSIDLIIVSVTMLKHLTVILMTLNQDCSRSCKVKGHGANRKPIGGFVSDLHCV